MIGQGPPVPFDQRAARAVKEDLALEALFRTEGLEVTGLSASSTRQGSYPGSLLVTVDGHLTHFASFTSSDSVAVAPDGSALYVAVEGKVYAVEAPSGLKSALRLLWDAGSGLPIGPLLVSPDGANQLAVEKNDNHPKTLFR